MAPIEVSQTLHPGAQLVIAGDAVELGETEDRQIHADVIIWIVIGGISDEGVGHSALPRLPKTQDIVHLVAAIG